jgi:hypothetical protein
MSFTDPLGATKRKSTLLVLFIPSVDRNSEPVRQADWVEAALDMLGRCLGGATAFPRARGVWRDDQRGGQLVFDDPVIIVITSEEALEANVITLRRFLLDMGQATNQGAVGLVIDRDYLEIAFPLEGESHG